MYICTPTSCSIFLITNHTHQTEMAGESNEFASFFQFMYPGGRWRCHGQNDSCKCIQSIQGDIRFRVSDFSQVFAHKKELFADFFWSLNSSLHRVCKKLSLLFVVRPVDPFSNLHAAKTLGFRLFFFQNFKGFCCCFF